MRRLTLACIKKNKLRQILFLLTIILFTSTGSIACSCGELYPISKSDYESSGEIFIGRVTKIVEDRGNWKKTVTFEVIDQLKTNQQAKEITISTAFDGGACGLSVKEGDKWYIFTYQNDNKELVAGLCGRSVNLDKKFRIKDYGLKYAFLEKRAWKKDFRRYKKEKRFIKRIK